MKRGLRLESCVLWDEFHLKLWRNRAGDYALTQFGCVAEFPRYEIVELLSGLGLNAERWLLSTWPRALDMWSSSFSDVQRRFLLDFVQRRESVFHAIPRGWFAAFRSRHLARGALLSARVDGRWLH